MSENLLRQLREYANRTDRQKAIDEACLPDKKLRVRDVSLDGCDLSGLNLLNLEMEQVDFRGAICCDVQFASLRDSIFDGVDASRSHFPRLEHCRFRQATLTEAYMGGRLSDCDFSGSVLRFAQLGPLLAQYRCEYRGNSFDAADLHGVDAAAGYLAGSTFKEARLTNARLSRADLSGCDLRGADLSEANLVNARLIDANTAHAVFDKCLVAADQEEQFRAVCREAALRTVSIKAGPWTADLERGLQAVPEYRLDWAFCSRGARQAQKIMMTKGAAPDELGVHAFHAQTHSFIRMYPMDEGPSVLSSILVNMAADYADYTVDLQTIRARLAPATTEMQIFGLLRRTLAELFAISGR